MTEIAQRTPQQELVEWVSGEERLAQIEQALPEGISLDRFSRATHTALLAKPELVKADRASLYIAILNAAQAGLVPDGKQGAIVVYNTKVKDDQGERWIEKAQFLPMIGGVRDTLAEFGWSLRTAVVYEGDEFAYDEAEARITHRPPRLGIDRGAIQGAYAIALHKDGRREAIVMTKEEIDYVRDKSSRSKKVWEEWYTRMAEKTPGHRLAKKLALDPKDKARIDRIINADELAPGEAATMLYGPRAIVATELPPAEEHQSPPSAGTGEAPPVGDEARPLSADSPTDADDEPEPEPAEDGGEPEIVDETSDADVKALADTAAMFIPPNGIYAQGGKNGPKSLSEIHATGADGEKWIKWALGKITAPQDYVDAVWRFARVYLPEAYTEVLAKKEASA